MLGYTRKHFSQACLCKVVMSCNTPSNYLRYLVNFLKIEFWKYIFVEFRKRGRFLCFLMDLLLCLLSLLTRLLIMLGLSCRGLDGRYRCYFGGLGIDLMERHQQTSLLTPQIFGTESYTLFLLGFVKMHFL